MRPTPTRYRPRRRAWLRRAAVAGTVLAAGVTAAGAEPALAAANPAPAGSPNGIAKLTPAAALAASAAALAKVPDLVISGTVPSGGTTLDLHLESTAHGVDDAGTLVSHGASLGFVGTIRFVSLDTKVYLQGGPAFWSQILGSATGLSRAQRQHLLAAVSDQWIVLSPADSRSITAGFGDLTRPAAFAKALTASRGKLHKGTPKKVGGVDALPVVSSRGGTLWIALDGPPLPVAVTTAGSRSGRGLAFSYPASLSITAPAGAKSLTQVEQAAAG